MKSCMSGGGDQNTQFTRWQLWHGNRVVCRVNGIGVDWSQSLLAEVRKNLSGQRGGILIAVNLDHYLFVRLMCQLEGQAA